MIRIAIVGWEEGSAGQVDSWAREVGFTVDCFVHSEDEPPHVDREKAYRGRDASLFDVPVGGTFKKRPLISSRDWPKQISKLGIGSVLVAVSGNRHRLAEMYKAREAGLNLVTLVHPTSTILTEAKIGANVIMHARSIVGYRTEIGDGVILNTGAQIDHHNVVRAGASIDPGVVTAGFVTVETCAAIHTGSIVINRRKIGADAVVCAGSVVVRDVSEGDKVAGVPARRVPGVREL